MSDNVLIIGGGGREHALAWKLAQSDLVERVVVAPGNGGTATAGGKIENIAIPVTEIDRLIEFARDNNVALTVVGPEAPLTAGIVDRFTATGLRSFGPDAAAARLEGSKTYAKALMERIGVPTAAYRVFTDHTEALNYVRSVDHDIVIKASGLAAGKGVIVPGSRAEAEQALHRIMIDREFGDAGDEVIIEEFLTGQEATLLAFCDGATIVTMPAAQDHKPLLDGDKGPNTGGMGAYAPTPLIDEDLKAEIVKEVMRPVIEEMAAEGHPYVGVLYAGLMLTPSGPKVLEFNCRFGDPEAQVILPLLRTDLYQVLRACVDGTLSRLDIEWRDGVAATVVAASAGYPGEYEKGIPISGLTEAGSVPGVTVFHAGTALGDGVVTAGGRVLAVTGMQPTLPMALACAYHGIEHIDFEGMQYRNDIGGRISALFDEDTASAPRSMTYAEAGVDIDAGNRAIAMMKRDVMSTYGPEVIGEIGGFGGMYDASNLGDDAVLVASTDGVGTKTKIATAMGRYDTIGQDIVNHCVNDVLVQGARPLFFLDYVATSSLDPAIISAVVGGMATACRLAGCALLGGETAEMPGVYVKGELDVVGTIIGVVARGDVIDHSAIEVGDVVIAIPSSGLHTNGFSLARRVFEHWDLNDRLAALGKSLGTALLAPHRSYLEEVMRVRQARIAIHSLVHVTGGGLVENPARVLAADKTMRIDRTSWSLPPLFALIKSQGNVPDEEMLRTFNLGVGMLVVVAAGDERAALETIGPDAWRIGEIIPRTDDPVVFT